MPVAKFATIVITWKAAVWITAAVVLRARMSQRVRLTIEAIIFRVGMTDNKCYLSFNPPTIVQITWLRDTRSGGEGPHTRFT